MIQSNDITLNHVKEAAIYAGKDIFVDKKERLLQQK